MKRVYVNEEWCLFDMLQKVATSVAFSPENRRKKFGGVV